MIFLTSAIEREAGEYLSSMELVLGDLPEAWEGTSSYGDSGVWGKKNFLPLWHMAITSNSER